MGMLLYKIYKIKCDCSCKIVPTLLTVLLFDFRYSPDVVYFQEVIPLSCGLLSSSLQDYKLIPGGQREYFTVVLLKKSSVEHLSDDIEQFPGSVMLRNLQTVQV